MLEMINLNLVAFLILGTLLTGYAVLDGFDLGVGIIHLFTKTDHERRIMLNSIGPIWDGNEVWLVTSGGAMFAAFPDIYATVFSGMYEAIMILLAFIVLRAVSIEFRSKQEMTWWRNMWDYSFGLSSISIPLVFGVALSHVITGLPIDEKRTFNLSLIELITPYSLLVGITTVSLFAMHGAIYVSMKTEGEIQNKIEKWINNAIILFIMCFITTTMVTLIYYPHMATPFKENPELFAFAFFNMLSIANIPREISKKRYFEAFASSSLSIIASMCLVGIGLFPNIVVSNINEIYNMTIYNSASSQKTLMIISFVSLVATPAILAYTSYIYWVFRGKVELDSKSY